MSRRPRAFTLIELLVVVSIIALLVSILLPALARARDAAKRAVCLANLHSFGQGLVMYAGDNNDRWPYIYNNTETDYDADGLDMVWQQSNGKRVIYYSSWQIQLAEPGQEQTGPYDWISDIRSGFLDLFVPSYIETAQSLFCPGAATTNKYMRDWQAAWEGGFGGTKMWSYHCWYIGNKVDYLGGNATSNPLATNPRYSFTEVWKNGLASVKALTPLFADFYYTYHDDAGIDTGVAVPEYTYHLEGQNIVFTDGHCEFARRGSYWFAPELVWPGFAGSRP